MTTATTDTLPTPQFFPEVDALSITTAARRRKDLGDLVDLHKSIRRLGVLEPLLCRRVPHPDDAERQTLELVAGFRRLTVARNLKIAVPVLDFGAVSDEQARTIELDENAGRKDFTTFEASEKRLAEISRVAEEIEREKTATPPPPVATKSGRVKKASTKATRKEIADRTGISPAAQAKAERHAALVKKYPATKKWRRGEVFALADALEPLAPTLRTGVAKLIVGESVDPAKVVRIAGIVGALSTDQAEKLLKREPLEVFKICKTAPPAEPKVLRTLGAIVAMIDEIRTKEAAKIPGVVGKLDAGRLHITQAETAAEKARDAALDRWMAGR